MKYWACLHNSADVVAMALPARGANSSGSSLIRENAHNPNDNEDQNRRSDDNA
jgi:hypothetical protein